MRIDRDKFYREYRAAFYPTGGLPQLEVIALNRILGYVDADLYAKGLDYFSGYEGLSYLLGTWKLESKKKTIDPLGKEVSVSFNPVTEVRASLIRQPGLYAIQSRYWKTGHYGRGLTQITWPENYYKLGEHPAIKGMRVVRGGSEYLINGTVLRNNPDLALDPYLSYRIATVGAIYGLFRPGNNLALYFKKGHAPRYVAARNIINGGGDQAENIAANAARFERILRVSMVADIPTIAVQPVSLMSPAKIGINDATEADIEKVPVGNIPPEVMPGSEELPPFQDADANAADRAEDARSKTPLTDLFNSSDTPTGDTANTKPQPPKTDVQPTALKGYMAAIWGFIVTNLGAAFTYLTGLPPIVQASIYLSGGIVTAALVFSVIWIKNQREERANQKDLELIRSKAKQGGDNDTNTTSGN